MTALAFVLAAAVGGVARWAATTWWHCTWQAVLGVNVVGSALFGWLLATDASPTTVTVVGTAFAGSFTTFSSFVWEVRRSRPGFALAYVALTLVGCLGVASIAAST
ncbi:MAG: CrcB family protein [Actinomycetota bacterium]